MGDEKPLAGGKHPEPLYRVLGRYSANLHFKHWSTVLNIDRKLSVRAGC